MVTPDGCDVADVAALCRALAGLSQHAAARPERGDWDGWIELLRNADDDDPHRAMTVVTSTSFGTVCSALLALPAAPSNRPSCSSPNGPPTRTAIRAPSALAWVRARDVEQR